MDIVVRRQSEQLSRRQLRHLSESMDDDDDNDKANNKKFREIYDYRRWEWGNLRTECKNLGLETFYRTYVQRLQRSYLSVFFVMHTIVGMAHTIVLVATQKSAPISPEVYCNLASIIVVWVSLISSFNEHLIKKQTWIPNFGSVATVIGLVMLDIIVPLYHSVITRVILRPSYDAYTIFAIYIFLPLPENLHSVILAMATTFSYLLVTHVMTYRVDEHAVIKTFTDLVYLLAVNFFGVYVRLQNEVAIRRAFLDRRECVEGNLLLRYARDQEKNLLLSILPAHTASVLEKAIRGMIEKIRQEKHESTQELNAKSLDIPIPRRQWRGQPIKLYIEHHKSVSVLYADVVNYTYITTQLPVKTLVDVLHELFVKFDQASEEYNVLRIKFLGDCYYCVSGVPEPNPQHARSCVDLGLRMIRDIREVRAQRNNLNIDMRIGVHSGSIMSGVIGACKWQYDIWSKDVSIANRLETTGVPGKVHITQQTLELLEDQYFFEPGTEMAKKDPVLIRNNIETFLISPQYYGGDFHYYSPDELNRRYSSGVKRMMSRSTRNNKKLFIDCTLHRNYIGKNFMQNSMEQYMQIMKQTNTEMALELDRMPIGKFHFNHLFSSRRRDSCEDAEYERSSFSSKVSTILLRFRNKKWEMSFLHEQDLMLKYSTFMCFIVFIGIIVAQALNNPDGWSYWMLNAVAFLVLLFFLAITWFKKIWILLRPINEDDPNLIELPTNPFLRYLFNTSKSVMSNAVARMLIYFVSVCVLTLSALIHLIGCDVANECTDEDSEVDVVVPPKYSPCSNQWGITQSLIMAICTNFLFVRIHFVLKLVVGSLIVGFYSWIIFGPYDFLFENGPSISASLDARVGHILIVIFITASLHMVDRQTEYITRVDYTWKQQLQQRQEESECTKDTIRILVQNILPAHVAEIYMNRQMKDELYYEEYDNVAIMFATITNYDIQSDATADIERNILSILNRIICDFDEKLLSKTGPLKLEKIKVSGWTYMVACGLDPGRSDSSGSNSGCSSPNQRTSLLSNGRRSWNTFNFTVPKSPKKNPRYDPSKRERKQSGRQSQNVVYVLTEFALELMRILEAFNTENFQSDGKLRIGIAHGKVMAGVVGSSKPLYDVWGNAVNMASRMDSTGIPGKIQLTKESAEELQSFGIRCKYRGETFIKGRGNIPTYFALINEQLEFVKEPQPVELHHFDTHF
ncbi:adenylyl cyclase X E-like isoform X2 [Sitodiplosis mosellana]|uniref:adenylyl cyclase X E-like isoform X2 n=1 Tax=Sitodiplosis mosellana TaxID=263140 RepID=UPI0024444EFD|nr:adenylyl cyclase X E-like isoform X2 [Sitodiplosis mosellana]